MKKFEKEYIEKYGDISSDQEERVSLLKQSLRPYQLQEYMAKKLLIENIEWSSQSFTIYLLPKGTPRPRSGKFGFYVKGAKDNKEYFERYLSELGDELPLIKTPSIFTCKSFLPTPSSMNKVEKLLAEEGFIRPTSKPDWDNLAKTYCDMIQGYTVYDDSLIIKGVSEKYYSLKPRIELTLSWMNDYDSVFNKRKIDKIFKER